MRFLPSIEFKRGNPADATARAVSNGQGGFQLAGMGGNYRSDWEFDKAVKHGYERLIDVFRCIDAISQNQANLQQFVQRGRLPGGRRVPDAQLEYVLNTRANPYETAWQFRYRLSSQLLLSPKGAFVEIVPNRAGRPAQLQLLNPSNVQPIPDPKAYVSGYRVTQANGQIDVLDPDQVVWIKLKPHPADPYRQMTPMMAAGLTVDTEFLSRVFNRSVVANNGRPAQLIGIKGVTNQEDAKELKQRLGGTGVAYAGRTSVLEGIEDIIVQNLMATPSDLQYIQGLAMDKEEIYTAFGTPESVLGNASGRTYDNADAERLNWWIDTMVPHCDGITSAWDVLTVGELDDDLFVASDYTKVDVLRKIQNDKAAQLQTEVKSGLRTIDSYLIEMGMEPFNVPGSKVLWLPAVGMMPIGKTDQDQQDALNLVEQIAGLMAPGQQGVGGQMALPANSQWSPAQQQYAQDTVGRAMSLVQKALDVVIEAKSATLKELDPKPIPEDDADDDGDDDDWLEPEPKHPGTELDVKKKSQLIIIDQKGHPYGQLRTALEGEMVGLLSAWSRRQADDVSQRLIGVKFRKGTRHWSDDSGIEVKESDRVGKMRAPQKCKYCDKPATKSVLHSEGMAYIPTCSEHMSKAKYDAEHCTPDKSRDPSNINKIYDVAQKSLDGGLLVDPDKWALDIASDMRPMMNRVVDQQLKRIARDIDNSGALGRYLEAGGGYARGTNPVRRLFGMDAIINQAKQAVVEDVANMVTNAAFNQSQRMVKHIVELDAQGKSAAYIEREVKRHTSMRSPWRKQLATNVTTALVESTVSMALNPVADHIERSWHCEHDERTREAHRLADGQKVDGMEPFIVGGFALRQPGDLAAPPALTVNCRCWQEFGVRP